MSSRPSAFDFDFPFGFLSAVVASFEGCWGEWTMMLRPWMSTYLKFLFAMSRIEGNGLIYLA
jgi:hypothetical protein